MSNEQNWMTEMMDKIAKKTESWPEWRKEEAKLSFEGSSPTQKEKTASTKKDSPPAK